MSREIVTLKRYFEGRSVHVSDYWLECCLDWFKSNNRNYNDSVMCTSVYEQWLVADLREIEVRSLPPNIVSQKQMVLEGSYAVQLMYVKDTSKSRLSQLNKIKNLYKLSQDVVDHDTRESLPQGKRMLYLYLTDGVLSITAFEYKPLQCIDINIAPGTKILLVGPLLIRNGEFLLENKNVKILGGEVEELLVSNAYENVLARELKLPENPNPISVNMTNDNLTIATQQNNSINQSRPVQQNYNEIAEFSEIDENLFLEDFEQIEELTNNQPVVSNEQVQQRNSYQQEGNNRPNQQRNIHLSVNNPPSNNQVMSSESCLMIEDEMFEDFNNDVYEVVSQKQPPNIVNIKFPISVSNKPYNYIKQLVANKSKLVNKTFRVKAQFNHIVQKIAVSSIKGWTMKFEITDGTGNLVVDILSDVIEDLIGISPEQIMSLKEKINNKDVVAADRLKEALFNCKRNLLEMNCFVDLQFTQENEDPIVINLQNITSDDLHTINKRVEFK